MSKISNEKSPARSNAWIFGTMLAFGIVGLAASFVLAVEKIHLLQDPQAILSCTINAFLDCSTVMQTWQSSLFGFPNVLIGLMAYPVVITVAVVMLAGGPRLPRWFWRAAHICYGLGALFAYWLFFQSVHVIEVLCPWCLIVTFATTMLFATIMHYNLRQNTWGFGKAANRHIQRFLQKDLDKLIAAAWIVLLVALVFIKFGDSLFV